MKSLHRAYTERKGKSMETVERSVVARGWRRRRNE